MRADDIEGRITLAQPLTRISFGRGPNVYFASISGLYPNTAEWPNLLKSLCAFGFGGGPFRARTGDPLIKSQLLYQLS